MSDQNMQFPIPNAVLEPYIKQAVSAAISASLGDGVALVGKAVEAAMLEKVASNGHRSNSSYDNKYPLVETVATNAIQKIARETINEMAEQMRPKIKEAIEKQLKAKHSAIAKTLCDSLIDSLSSTWAVSVKVETPHN